MNLVSDSTSSVDKKGQSKNCVIERDYKSLFNNNSFTYNYMSSACRRARTVTICVMTLIEGIFFAISMFYFIAKVIDLLVYSSSMPSHKILSFSILSFCIAILPSLLALFGATYVKAKNFDYTTEPINPNKDFLTDDNKRSLTDDNKDSLTEDNKNYLTEDNKNSSTVETQKTIYPQIISKVADVGFAFRAVFETAGACFWLVLFLNSRIKNFFLNNRTAMFFLVFFCLIIGILRSIAIVRAYKNTIKKSEQKNNVENKAIDKNIEQENDVESKALDKKSDQKNDNEIETRDKTIDQKNDNENEAKALDDDGKSDSLASMSLVIGFFLTIVGCFSAMHPKTILASFNVIAVAIGATISEYICTYAKLCINKTKNADQNKKDPKAIQSSKIALYLFISLLHNIAHFVQKTFPACLSLLKYFTENNIISNKNIIKFWLIASVPAFIWMVIAIKNDLYNLKELSRRREAKPESESEAKPESESEAKPELEEKPESESETELKNNKDVAENKTGP